MGIGDKKVEDGVGSYLFIIQCCSCLSSQPPQRRVRRITTSERDVDGRYRLILMPERPESSGRRGSRGKIIRIEGHRERTPEDRERMEDVLVRRQPSVRQRKLWHWRCSTARWRTSSGSWRERRITPRSSLRRKARRTISRATPPFCRKLWAVVSQHQPVLRKNSF